MRTDRVIYAFNRHLKGIVLRCIRCLVFNDGICSAKRMVLTLNHVHCIGGLNRYFFRGDMKKFILGLERAGNEIFAIIMSNNIRRTNIFIYPAASEGFPEVCTIHIFEPGRWLIVGGLIHNVQNWTTVYVENINIYYVVELKIVLQLELKPTRCLGISLAWVTLFAIASSLVLLWPGVLSSPDL